MKQALFARSVGVPPVLLPGGPLYCAGTLRSPTEEQDDHSHSVLAGYEAGPRATVASALLLGGGGKPAGARPAAALTGAVREGGPAAPPLSGLPSFPVGGALGVSGRLPSQSPSQRQRRAWSPLLPRQGTAKMAATPPCHLPRRSVSGTRACCPRPSGEPSAAQTRLRPGLTKRQQTFSALTPPRRSLGGACRVRQRKRWRHPSASQPQPAGCGEGPPCHNAAEAGTEL